MRKLRNSVMNRLRRGVALLRGRPMGGDETNGPAPWADPGLASGMDFGDDKRFGSYPNRIPVPSRDLRQTVSRPDMGGFYFIGENWAYSVAFLLAKMPGPTYNVLDLGCGVGKTARFLGLDPRINYVGFDIYQPAIEWANKAFPQCLGDRFRFEHFDGISKFYNPAGTIDPVDYEFPVPDASVDVAFAASLFTHLYENDARAYLEKTAAKLKPTGKALFSITLLPKDATVGTSGTEQSIKMQSDYFVNLARDCGLHHTGVVEDICGQTAFHFVRTDGELAR